MRRANIIFLMILGLAWTASAGPAGKLPAEFDCITVAPANKAALDVHVDMHPEEDEICTEQPPTVSYFEKNTKTYATSMTVTDLSLCKKPDQKETCDAFVKMIAGAPPAMGEDITGSRIGGCDFTTAYLAKIDSVKLEGVDSFSAFLGGDSQDPPMSQIVLYVYAKKGTNLIQLDIPVDECKALPDPNESEFSYYKRRCVTQAVLEKARAQSRVLVDLFRWK